MSLFNKHETSVAGELCKLARVTGPVCMGVHRVTDLEKFPVRVSRDEAPTPLPLFGLAI